MSSRRRPGLDAIRGAVAEAAPAVYLVPIDDVPRAALRPAEVAAVLGVPIDRIYDEIAAGNIPLVRISGSRHHIPTSWLAQIQAEARPLDPTA